LDRSGIKVVASNRKAFHEFTIGESWEAGLVLTGTEVKSIRAGKVNLSEGWVDIDGRGEAWLVEVHISPYSHGNLMNHPEKRARKLLLQRKEIIKITHAIEAQGMSLVPIKLYMKGQRVKVEIALARGKKLHDKRDANKTKDANREVARAMRQRSK
jgi:SsrA-binding protein